MNQNKDTPDAPPSTNRRFFLWFTILCIFSLTSVLLWRWFEQPNQGVVSTVVPATEKLDLSKPEHRKRYQGKYFTFTYPYDFNRRAENEDVKYPLLERVYLSRSDIEGRKIAVTLQDNTGNSFEEYSSFRIRRNDTKVYQEEQKKVSDLKVTLFSKTSSVFEVSAFFYRGNQVVSITVSSPTTDSGLHEEVINLLESFAWTESEKGSQ